MILNIALMGSVRALFGGQMIMAMNCSI